MKIAALLLFLALVVRDAVAQKPLAHVHVYRTGIFSVGIHVCVDKECEIHLSQNHTVTFDVAPGEHLFSAKVSRLNPVRMLTVEPNEDYYLILDYERGSMAHLMLTGDTSQAISLTLERSNAAPDDKTFKQDSISAEVAGRIAATVYQSDLVDVPAPASIRTLTDLEVNDAVLQGLHDSSDESIGLYLEDVQTSVLSHAVNDGIGLSGFAIRVYTAPQWIELQAAHAHHLMAPFTATDVDAELRQDLLRVVALPNTPDSLTGRNMSVASNVQRVVLQNLSTKLITQPLDSEATTLTLDSALRSQSYSGLVSAFPTPDLKKEFNILVIGDGDVRKTFTVKDKYLHRLR